MHLAFEGWFETLFDALDIRAEINVEHHPNHPAKIMVDPLPIIAWRPMVHFVENQFLDIRAHNVFIEISDGVRIIEVTGVMHQNLARQMPKARQTFRIMQKIFVTPFVAIQIIFAAGINRVVGVELRFILIHEGCSKQ